MSEKKYSPDDVLHAAKLYMAPATLVGRRVTGRAESITFSAFVVSCVIDKGAMTLELSLSQFAGRKLRALIYAAPTDEWRLHFQRSSLEVDAVEFSAT